MRLRTVGVVVLGDVDDDGNPELVAPSNTGSLSIVDEILVIYDDGRVVALSYA